MKKIIAVIPARMGSTRFPGKPIVDICGLTMIEHVWRRVRMCKKISEVYIITCDLEIKDAAEAFGAKVVMTSPKHSRCTDRAAEAAQKLVKSGKKFDILLNIQGDEPLLNPKTLDLLIRPFLEEKKIAAVNMIESLKGEAEISSKNNVKTVFDQNNFALYFSRQPIPTGAVAEHYKQLGIYGLTRKAILQYAEMKETPLEIAESDDMLRFLENGIPVKVVISPYKTKGVDTPADCEDVCRLMVADAIFRKYGKIRSAR